MLELWGIKIGPIIAGLGLFGVAVALGAQDLFKNLISGILVLVERRFQVGDWNLLKVLLTTLTPPQTGVRRFDKSLATIPNFQFAENAVINNSQITNRRINWMIGLEYKTTSEQLKNIKIQIGAATEDLDLPPEDLPVQGRDLLTGKPKQVQTSYREIAKALDKSILRIEDSVMETLSKTPPELNVILRYLPKQLTDEEITTLVKEGIENLSASSMQDMGKLMGYLKPKLEGKADMSVVSVIIKELLA